MVFNMSWLWGSSSTPAVPATPDPQPTQAQTNKPKPCCVCKDEKATRDDCMLFSKSDDPTQDCRPVIDQYKSCMAGYGFKI